ncbi:MAG TPA: cell envelope biogenesis protein OmpA [Candidatus Marinimicrobia bacterium]|nr:cell envelope biogenesis protein OmpA [Candidatus Neomarinimicrobiota bacterium]
MAEEIRRKRKNLIEESGKEQEPWLITYGDMMTLLMTFFVLLFSMSTIDPVKLEQFSDSVGQALGKKTKTQKYSLAEIYSDVVKVIEEENLQEQIQVETSERGVAIKIPSEISFGIGSADLNPRIYPILNKFEDMMKKSTYPIAIEGHTDNVPIRSVMFPSNWELSAARAAQVVRYYIARGIPPERFQAIGYADTRPRAPGATIADANATPQRMAMNRRVEIFFLTIL